jgi:phosphoribosyl-AMP cyclohydrolase / phosphoribosyl-ATP pyrophosphohydrolase
MPTRKSRRPRFPAAPGLLPTVIQDAQDGTVLGLAYSNRTSWSRLCRTRQLVLFSRSRRRLWRKGATSGHTATVVATATDCDGDALLVQVVPRGPFCHTGERSCFDRSARTPPAPILPELEKLIAGRRRTAPQGSYTAELLRDEERRLKKVGEEATEVVVAAARKDRDAVIRESRDLLYHLLVLYAPLKIRWSEVEAALRARRRGDARPRVRRSAPR